MPRYFFDSRDGDDFLEDEEGSNWQTWKRRVTKATRRDLATDVRDESGRQLLRASLSAEIQVIGS